MTTSDVSYVDIGIGDDIVVIVQGTPCNVEIDYIGVHCWLWAAEADAPHAKVTISWPEILERALPL